MRRALLLLFLPLTASGAQVELTRTQLCEFSERIVIGEVTDVEHRPTEDDSIERKVHLAVSHTLKGPASDDATVTAPGGTLGDLTLWVEHSPKFLIEARYMLFIRADGHVVGGEQGTIRVAKGEQALKGETLESAIQSIEDCRAK